MNTIPATVNRAIVVLVCVSGVMCGQSARYLLLNGIAHTGNGKVIERSAILISGGIIKRVSDAASHGIAGSEYDTLIDFSGKHIYPALINPNNVLGLHDAEAVRATRDYAEVGRVNPHVRSLIAYNTDNIVVPTVKTNGVLYTQVTPRSGLISGSSSIMALEGWNWEDAVLRADDGVQVNFPRMVVTGYSAEEEAVTRNANKSYHEDMNFLDKFFTDARAYLDEPGPAQQNLRFEAMRDVLIGKSRLYIHADKARDILAALELSSLHKVPYPVIVGGREAWRVTAELRKRRVPVMLNRINDLPERDDDPIDLVNRLPYLLTRDSVLFCFQMEGDMEAMNSRNLPFNAGVSVAYGLTKEQALAAMTSNAAKIMGVDQLIGTLEEGKVASLVVSEGDILDIRSNSVIFALLAGNQVKLTNHQSLLYEKYRIKYRLK
jgi:imidazolonepropionase-like amidohydrolase